MKLSKQLVEEEHHTYKFFFDVAGVIGLTESGFPHNLMFLHDPNVIERHVESFGFWLSIQKFSLTCRLKPLNVIFK